MYYHTTMMILFKLSLSPEDASWPHKLLWLLTNVGFDAAVVVTILYWTLVFEGEKNRNCARMEVWGKKKGGGWQREKGMRRGRER